MFDLKVLFSKYSLKQPEGPAGEIIPEARGLPMSKVFQKLEEKINELLDMMEHLESENNSFRSLVGAEGEHMTQAQVINRLESLKLEKEKLERKLASIEKGLEKALEKLEKLDF